MGAAVVNPELYLGTLTEGGKLVMEVRVEPGIGYVPAEIHATKDRINSIPVDAVFTPVRRVAYRVEDTRVGQKTDLDRLVLRVWTDGSISPKEALESAVETLRNQLSVFSGGDFEEPMPVMAMPTTSAAAEPAALDRGRARAGHARKPGPLEPRPALAARRGDRFGRRTFGPV